MLKIRVSVLSLIQIQCKPVEVVINVIEEKIVERQSLEFWLKICHHEQQTFNYKLAKFQVKT